MPGLDINQFRPENGRRIKEDSTLINIADYYQVTDGLPYATLRGEAGVFTARVTAQAGETVALNLFFDKKTVIARVVIPINGFSPITSVGSATGDYGAIITPQALNLVDGLSDNSQGQIVYNAVVTGNALGGNGINGELITNGASPINVSFTNTNSTAVTQDIIVKFFDLNDASVLTLLESTTQLESNTEMSTYGAN